jgi:hypothetical protein
MPKSVSGTIGFLTGAVVGVIVVLLGCQVVWAGRAWFQRTTGEDLECMPLLIHLYLAKLTLVPAAAILFGSIGCWLAVRDRRS